MWNSVTKMAARAKLWEPGHVIEVVGLEKGDRGRSCERHKICGQQVTNGDVLRFMYECIHTPEAGTLTTAQPLALHNPNHI
jgi:hypothetical protein